MDVIRKGVRRGKIKFLCKSCHGWFQINRGEKKHSKEIVRQHLQGVSFRSLGAEYDINPSTAYRRYKSELLKLPHCADITRRYSSRFCGILLVDGKYVKVKGHDRKIPVLYGIDYLTHDIPTYILSVSENYQTCRSFFASLKLLNYPLQAIVSDDNINIYQACLSVYPKALIQICQNHYKQSLRISLNVGTEEIYRPFMRDIEFLFEKRRSKDEFLRMAGKIYVKYEHDLVLQDAMLNIQKRFSHLLAYTNLPQLPRTTNLIESYNSHLEGRLKTIKGFESFKHADIWLNAYFVRRRIRKFTDCGRKFKALNGKCSLEITLKKNYKIDDVLQLIR